MVYLLKNSTIDRVRFLQNSEKVDLIIYPNVEYLCYNAIDMQLL